jgi:hypothetical protein
MNDFYSDSGVPATNAIASSSTIRAEFALIEAGFDKMPTLSGNGGKVIAINAGATALEALTTTGTGSAVRATSPTLVTPILGTPTSGTLTNCTGLPVSGLASVTATAAELNILDGATATAADLVAMGEAYASFTFATGWATHATDNKVLRRSVDGFVTFGVFAAASGSPTLEIGTLPAGYRPTVPLSGIPAVYHDDSDDTHACEVGISTAGVVTVQGLLGVVGAFAADASDRFSCLITFPTR